MKKLLKKIILGLFIITLGFGSIYVIAKADSGWDSDYDSDWGSDSSWDSDYDSDWGSDSSWDSDYDSNWGSNWNSSNGHYSNGSRGGSLSGDYFFIIFVIIVIIIIIISRNNSRKRFLNMSRNISNMHNNHKDMDINKIKNMIPNIDINDFKQTQYNYYEDIDINKIKEIDPNLDITEFKQRAYNIYKDIQEAWMNFDTDTIRNLTTDELYNMYKSQLDTLKLKKQKNIMKNFELKDIKIFDIKKEGDVITLKVYLNVSCYDYVIKEATGEITRGTDKMKMNIKYELSFVKSSTNNKKIEKCPNCGAPVNIISSSTCPYCDSILVKNSSDYVMSKKTSVGQTMER